MQQLDLIWVFVKPLDSNDLDYFVTGSVASIVYGEPRLTHDVDIVLHLGMKEIDKIIEAFPLDDFYCPPPEVIRVESSRTQRGHFNIIHHETGHKADIYLKGRHPLQSWAMKYRRLIELSGGSFWIAPPEYVILRKLEFFREGDSEKHLRDIRGMLELSTLDMDMIEEWIQKLGVEEQWKKASE